MATNITQSKEPLNNFFDESYGYNKIPSGQNAPELFLSPPISQKAREISKNGLADLNLSPNLTKLKNEITSPDFSQNQPLFVDIIINNKGLNWKLNPQAKPFVYRLEKNPTYQKAEAATDHDSSFYGLVAATVPDTASRKELYNIAGKLICHGIQNSPDIGKRLENVFLGKNTLSTALVMSGVHQRADLFPGISVKSEADYRLNYDSRLVNQWVANWQNISRGIEQKLNQGKKLSLTDIKNIEVFSHLFLVDKILGRVINATEVGNVSAPPKPPEIKNKPQPEKSTIEFDKESRNLLHLVNESFQYPKNKNQYGYSRLQFGWEIKRLIHRLAQARHLQKQNPNNSLENEVRNIEKYIQESFVNDAQKEKNILKQHSKTQRAIDVANIIYEDQYIRSAVGESIIG